MKLFSKQKISLLMLFTLMLQLFVPYFTYSVFAEDSIQDPSALSVTIKEVITGTEPFNTTNKSEPGFYPGDDYARDDNYVRTLDTVAYTIDYGINPAGSVAKNAVLIATLSADKSGNPIAVWDLNLKKLYPGVTISSDGRTLEYKLGDKEGGNAYGFSPTAKILGTAKNEEKFNLDVTFSADNASSISTSTKDIDKEITVSAFPKLDLGIDCYRTETVVGPSGELGVLLSSTIEVLIKNGKGSENVQEDLNFEVDLSKFRELGLSPILYNFSNKKAVAESGAWGGVQSSSLAPDGKGGGEKAVTNSGNFNAIQSNPGGDVEITISGADLSGNHTPSKYPSGDIISLEDEYVVSGYLALWISADQIPVGETEVEVFYKNFDPNSISNQSNFGEGIEPLENNKDTRKIRKPKGNGQLSIDEFYVDKKGSELPAEDDIWDRNGVLVSGAEFRTVVRMYNNGFGSIKDAVVVNKFDPNLVDLIKSSGIAHSIESSSNINNDDIIVEYGTGEYNDWQEQRNAVASSDGWYENINDVHKPISKIRLRMKDGKNIPPRSNIKLKIYMKTKDKPIGTIIPNFLSYKSSELNSGEWRHSSYDPKEDTGYSYRSDRVTITGAEARIEVNSDKDTVKAGDTVKYTIKSTLTADPPGTYGTAENVEVIDILPEDLIYVPNSAKRGSSYMEPEITKNADQTTTLKWNLGDQLINEEMEDITFDVKVGMDAKNLTSLNDKVIINTPTDISREAVRTSQKTVTVTNDTAWGVYKIVDKDMVEIEEGLSYTLNYFQLTDKTLNDFEFIDILPYNGDGRSPKTNFKGSYSLKSISGKHGETFLVTDEDPKRINKDPEIDSTTWSPMGSIDAKDVTAIKILIPDFQKNQPTREIKLVLEPEGNKGGDIYTNNFTGRVSDIDAMVESNDVSIEVVSSTVEGLVWEDSNGNEKLDSDEKGISNIKVKLLDDNGAAVLDNSGTPVEINTNINGEYKFENLKSGNYKVQIKDESLNNYNQTYEYDGSLDQISSVSVSKNQKLIDVNFGYKQNEGSLEVRYLEKGTGNELLPKEESTKPVGESYKTDKKEIAGYKFVSLDGLEEGQYVEGKTVVTYYYEKNPEILKKGKVVVFHKWGEKLLKFEDLGEKEVGTEYTTNPLMEEKYKDFKVIVPENKDGKYIEGTIEVIYYYINTNPDKPIEPEKKIGEVIVKYLEKNTNKELAEEDLLKDEVGKDYKTQEKQIDGYKILEKPSNAQGKYIEGKIEVIYYYEKETEKPIEPEKKMGEVIVKYLEKNTKEELSKEDSLKDEVGKDYATQEKQIDGYKLVEKTSNTQGQYIQGTIEVIYYYEKEIEKTEERPSKKRKRKPKEEKVEIPDEEIPQGKPEVEVEIPDEEVPQGKPEIQVEIPDEEIPQGKPKLLPKTGEKIPYSNYIMGSLIMVLGGALVLRRRKNS